MMKNKRIWVLAVMMIAGACSSKAAWTDGTYQEIADGFNGNFTVSVVISDGKITEVSIGDNSETEGVGSKAIDQLPSLIIEAQSAEVDSISGATYTSKGILEAVEAALETAAE